MLTVHKMHYCGYCVHFPHFRGGDAVVLTLINTNYVPNAGLQMQL